ncbi:MAG TPA: hypothetical protein VMS79_00185 [Methanomassiliicoccales archaeon]|nr:hypothetical protein [Methanomassiliicoccales archaeon]
MENETPASKASEKEEKIRCPSCGWTGSKDDLVRKEVELEATDFLKTAMQTILSSPVQHKCDYSCPSCGRLLGEELKFFQPYWDQYRTE